jgi:mannose-6-phosphate isomerase-like protein (cupin superfamily)
MVEVGKTNLGVGVVYRSAKAAQSAVEHDNLTEVYQILEGSGTLMTGGEIVGADGKPATTHDATGPSGPSLRGTALRGAESRHVGPGDIVIIPSGVGHIFSSIDGTIKYVVVRVDPDRVLPLK